MAHHKKVIFIRKNAQIPLPITTKPQLVLRLTSKVSLGAVLSSYTHILCITRLNCLVKS